MNKAFNLGGVSTGGISVTTQAGGICVLRMDRPRRGNAMSVLSVRATMQAMELLDEDGSLRCLIFIGEGPGFCAGSDIVELAAMRHEERLLFEAHCGALSRKISRYRVPVIAAVHGYALGGGLTLAASCDIVVSAADCRFGLPEVPIGLFPAWGLHAVESRCGRVVTRQLAFGFDEMDGETARLRGLVDRIAADPFAAALNLAQKISVLPADQLAAVKEYFAPQLDAESSDEAANKLFGRSVNSAEAAQTFARFGRRFGTTGGHA